MRRRHSSIAFARLFANDRRGATAIEYGMIALFIAIAIVASLKDLASSSAGLWSSNANKVTEASR